MMHFSDFSLGVFNVVVKFPNKQQQTCLLYLIL